MRIVQALGATIVLASFACGDGAAEGGAGEGGSETGGTGHGGRGGAGVGGGGGGMQTLSCPSEEQLSVLTALLADFDAAVGLLSGHPSAAEVTGFLIAPALPAPPAVVGFFAGPLIAPCSEPSMFEPFCQEGRCNQIECTGDGAGWINHVSLEQAPFVSDERVFDDVTLDNAWSDGSDTTDLALSVQSSDGEGAIWDLSATGTLGPEVGTIRIVFPALFETEATLDYETSRAGHTGALKFGSQIVATVQPDGTIEAASECR